MQEQKQILIGYITLIFCETQTRQVLRNLLKMTIFLKLILFLCVGMITLLSVMLSLLFSYSPSYVVTFPAENICISLTSEALVPVPNSVYHEVIENLASLLPAASRTAGTGRQGSYTWGFLLVFHASSCIFPQACSLLFGNLK